MPGPSALHRDEGGQISALAVLCAAAFAALLLLVINTGHTTAGKIALQNNADVSAVSGATWIARGLNVISLNNVTETQLVAIALIIPALKSSLDAAEQVLELESEAALLIPFVGEAISAAIQLQINLILEPLLIAVELISDLGGRDGLLWEVAQFLQQISEGVRDSFFAIAEAETIRVAGQNGAEYAFLVPSGLFQVRLPVHPGEMRDDLCDPMRNGSPTGEGGRGYSLFEDYGYPPTKGPFEYYSDNLKSSVIFYALFNSGIRYIFDLYRDIEYAKVCGAGSVTPRPTQQRISKWECQFYRRGEAVWSRTVWHSKVFDQPKPMLSEADRASTDKPAFEMHPCGWTPPGRIVVPENDTGPDGKPRYWYDVTEYSFIDATKPGPPAPPPSGGESESRSDDPAPYLLGARDGDSEEDARRELRYLVVVYRRQLSMIAPTHFTSPLGPHRLAYGQAKVYNQHPRAFDTFTQDWRVALEPASMLEEPEVLQYVVGKAGSVGQGAALLGRFSSGLMAFFNNH